MYDHQGEVSNLDEIKVQVEEASVAKGSYDSKGDPLDNLEVVGSTDTWLHLMACSNHFKHAGIHHSTILVLASLPMLGIHATWAVAIKEPPPLSQCTSCASFSSSHSFPPPNLDSQFQHLQQKPTHL